MRVRHWRLSEIDNDSTERQPTEWCIMAIVVLRLMHTIHILHIFRATNGPTYDLYSLLCSCNPVHSGMLKYDFSNMCLRVCAPPKKSPRDWWFLVIMMRLHAGEPHVFRTTNDNSCIKIDIHAPPTPHLNVCACFCYWCPSVATIIQRSGCSYSNAAWIWLQ